MRVRVRVAEEHRAWESGAKSLPRARTGSAMPGPGKCPKPLETELPWSQGWFEPWLHKFLSVLNTHRIVHLKYAENFVKRMTFKNTKSLSSVTVIFNLCWYHLCQWKCYSHVQTNKGTKKITNMAFEQRKTFKLCKRGSIVTPKVPLFRSSPGHLGNKPRTTNISFHSTLKFTAQYQRHWSISNQGLCRWYNKLCPLVIFLMSLNLSFLIFKMSAITTQTSKASIVRSVREHKQSVFNTVSSTWQEGTKGN